MKKIYIEPSLVEVQLGTTALLAGSDKVVNSEKPTEYGSPLLDEEDY